MIGIGERSHLRAEPINGEFITPYVENGDYCYHCGREIRLSPLKPQDAYWFHVGTYIVECLESEIIKEKEHEE